MFLVFCVMCNRADILVFSAAARHQIEEEFRDIPARFGGLIPSDGIKVFNIYNMSHTYDACVTLHVLRKSNKVSHKCTFLYN